MGFERITVAGLGAVGGFIAARLLRAGHRPRALVTPRHLEPLRREGLRFEDVQVGSTQAWPIEASDDARTLGEQDLVILAPKASSLSAMADGLKPLIGPKTVIVAAMNGIPWWFAEGLEQECLRAPLESVDPGGRIARALPPRQVVGGVVHLASSMPSPGHVRHASGQRIMLGSPTLRASANAPRVATQSEVRLAGVLEDPARQVSKLFESGGIEAPVVPDIHFEVWSKLWGNLTMNPLSVLTCTTMDRILDDPETRAFASAAMLEAGEVGDRLGIRRAMTPDERHEIASRLGAVKTSMLQDFEAGRPIELDPIVTAAVEIADRLQVPVPMIRALLGLTRLRARVAGLYPAPVRG